MNKSILFLSFILLLLACEKEDDEPVRFKYEIPSNFKYVQLSPSLKMTSYDTLKNTSCGITPIPFNSVKSYTMDIDGNFSADFNFKIQHRRVGGSSCPQYFYEAIISSVDQNALIAVSNEYAKKFERDSLISSGEWRQSAYIHLSSSSSGSHTFSGRKFIGFSYNLNGKTHYGYFQVEFPQTELYISSYAVNFLNSDLIYAGREE